MMPRRTISCSSPRPPQEQPQHLPAWAQRQKMCFPWKICTCWRCLSRGSGHRNPWKINSAKLKQAGSDHALHGAWSCLHSLGAALKPCSPTPAPAGSSQHCCCTMAALGLFIFDYGLHLCCCEMPEWALWPACRPVRAKNSTASTEL